ncbi:MAG: energy-coupling factor transporter transmembrane component T family protein [Anaerolineae bacterium]
MLTNLPSPLRRIDARAKLAWLLATFVMGVVFTTIPSLSIILGSILAVALIGRVFKAVVINLKGMWVIIAMIGLIFSVTVGGETLFYLLPPGLPLIGGHLPVSREGLQLGIISVLRMFVYVLPVVIMVMTTSNSDMLRALMFVRLPMEFALMIVLALNFVPLYIEEMGRIADAQRARAHSLMDKGTLGKMRGMVPIFLPLTLNAVDRADTIGKVLEIRGFAHGRFTVDFERLAWDSWLLIAFSAVLLALALASVALKSDLILAGLQTIGG